MLREHLRGLLEALGVPFEARCALEVPAGAMHSFRSEHNEIVWKIVVKGQLARWPDFQRSFPILVYPNGNGRGPFGHGITFAAVGRQKDRADALHMRVLAQYLSGPVLRAILHDDDLLDRRCL